MVEAPLRSRSGPRQEAAVRYRKRPVSVDAFRLGFDPMADWFCTAKTQGLVATVNRDGRVRGRPDYAVISTLEGDMRAEFGDWVIRGVAGEIYPCKPDIFARTYEVEADRKHEDHSEPASHPNSTDEGAET